MAYIELYDACTAIYSLKIIRRNAMTKVFFIALLGLTSLSACAQQSAPDVVTKAFQAKFPHAQNVKWEMEENSEWEAEFKTKGEKLSACFDGSGKWIKTEKEIKNTDLPSDVKNSLDKKLKDYELEEVERLETPDFNGYEIELEQKETEIIVWVTDSGQITVNGQTGDDDEEEGDDDEEEGEDDGDDDDDN